MEKTENQRDSNFEDICEISLKVFQEAKKKMAGEKLDVKIQSNEIKEKRQALLNEVNFINEIEAKRMISEAILDLGYITNPEVKILSLRLGKIYKTQQKVS